MSPARSEIPKVQRPRRAPYFLSFVFIAACVVGAATWYYAAQRGEVQRRAFNEMETIAELKAQSVSKLMGRYGSQLRRTARSSYFDEEARLYIAGERAPSSTQAMRARLDLDLGEGGFYDMALLDREGGVLVSATRGGDMVLAPQDHALVASAATPDEIKSSSLYLDAQGRPMIDLIAPIPPDPDSEDGEPPGFVLARVDPAEELYPTLLTWPVPSETGETLLVRRDGDQIAYLSELRHRKGTVLKLALPVTVEALPAARAVLGDLAPAEGTDYRGEHVIAASGAVSDLPWWVIAKVDAAEVYGPLRTLGITTVLIVTGLTLTAGATTSWLWNRQNTRSYQSLLESEGARAHAEDALAESEERYRLAVESTSDALWDLDVSTGNMVVSSRYYTMLGYEPDEWPPTMDAWRGLVHSEDLAYAESALETLSRGASFVAVEFRLREQGGAWRWVLLRASVVERREDGTPVRIIGTHADISERKAQEDELAQHRTQLKGLVRQRTEELEAAMEQLQAANEELAAVNEELDSSNSELDSANDELQTSNAELERLNAELKQANQAKSSSLANMSHELRTPLNSILGFTGIILQGLAGPLTDEQHKQLEMVQHSGRHLLALINDILDLQRVEAGLTIAHSRDCMVHDLVVSLVDTIRPLAEEKGLEVQIDLSDAPEHMVVDSRGLEQILLNLLGNAVKFTERGEIGLRVWSIDSLVRFAVCDTGPGIPVEKQDAVFGEFIQLPSDDELSPTGTGLGLSVSRHLARDLGGRVELESTPGEGSTFTLVLPLQADEGHRVRA
ncbi:MAG: ATP-binding protein [Actinomycetota bacterium]|nr:ATP-binding protein [Actinomycetota bacterium]